MAVTPRQRAVYDFIRRYIGEHGYSPTTVEIRDEAGLRSHSTVIEWLAALEREGLIRRTPNVSRGIEVVEAGTSDCEIPLLGVVAAGRPIEAVLTRETVCVPRDLYASDRFALRVRGDSMVGEGINDGDLILVQSRETAENGQTVVALIDEGGATVKRFYRERGRIRLEPANPRHKPIFIKPPQRLRVQGVLVGLIRRYQQ